jgi:hypothetical protein
MNPIFYLNQGYENMQSITINVKDSKLAEKVTWLLEHFQEDGLEIISKEDLDDLKLLKATRDEECIPFEQYLKHEH